MIDVTVAETPMLARFALGALLCVATPVFAAQIDIVAPGSVAFGSAVKVLPNGNFVVTDPDGPTANIGTVYLYTPAGIRISDFTGSSPNDHVGSGGVVVLANGNFIVVSPHWTNGSMANAGAVTWVNGITGLSGVVSADNSLVGTSANDQVGFVADPVDPPFSSVADASVLALANGNYLVTSLLWNNGAATKAGAVTFGNGMTGVSGAVSAVNSLVGTHSNDQIGSYFSFELANGNVVVVSPTWSSALASQVGAVTWMSGTQGLAGAVSPSNSLVGLSADDQVGSAGLTALANGNYVVLSPTWSNGAASNAGAATWASANLATSGVVSPANSLIGSTAGDEVGIYGAVALGNGNYVVASPMWSNGATSSVGAVTWGDGSVGISGAISAANSLIGSTANDTVGAAGVYALSNGNYVVGSPQWNNGAASFVGAVSWGEGTTGVVGAVSPANSLVGTSAFDQIGSLGVYVLGNANYVVLSPHWSNGAASSAGAVTWADGNVGAAGAVTTTNSLVGSSTNDRIGIAGAYPLHNGNYVIASYAWSNNGAAFAGAVTWADGTIPVTGAVSSSNSLVGTQANDLVGDGYVTALANGNYVVSSSNWNNGAAAKAGAVTWGNGAAGISGAITPFNSLVGTRAGDGVGRRVRDLNNGSFVVSSPDWNNPVTGASKAGAATWSTGAAAITGNVTPENSFVGTNDNDQIAGDVVINNIHLSGVRPLGDEHYLVFSQNWNNGAVTAAGAITLASSRFALRGTVQAYNSVRGTMANEGGTMPTDYDEAREQLVVGRPQENTVSLLTMDQIFAAGFE